MFFTFWEDLGNTPARVNRYTGEIQINNRYWRDLPLSRKRFIVEHEKGHFLLDTRNEFEADRYAFNRVAGKFPRSLKESVYSLTRVLTFRNPEHMDRAFAMLKLALEFDAKNNGNQEAAEFLEKLNEKPIFETMTTNSAVSTYHNSQYPILKVVPPVDVDDSFDPDDNSDGFDDDDYDNGAGKERREARRAKRQEKKATKQAQKEQKRELKNQKIAAQNEIKLARADAKRTKANAKMTLAEQGKSGNDWIGSAVSGVASLFGKKSADSGSGDGSGESGLLSSEGGFSSSPNSGKLLGMPKGAAIAVIVVVVLLVIGGVVFFVLKKKKK